MSLERGRYYAIFGALVTRERKRKKFTQAELGELVDVHQSTVARIEAGTTTVDTFLARQLARVLFDRSWPTVDARIKHIAERYHAAQEAVSPERIASRDAERALINYVVEVAAA